MTYREDMFNILVLDIWLIRDSCSYLLLFDFSHSICMFASGTWNLIPQWSTLLTFLPWVLWYEELHTLPSPLIQTPSVLVEPADLNTFRAEAVSRRRTRWLTGGICLWWPIKRGEYSSLAWRLGYCLLSDGRHMWSYFKCLWRVKTPPNLNSILKIDPLFERSQLFETIILGIHVSFGGCISCWNFTFLPVFWTPSLRWFKPLCWPSQHPKCFRVVASLNCLYQAPIPCGMEVWRMMFLFMLEWFSGTYIYIYMCLSRCRRCGVYCHVSLPEVTGIDMFGHVSNMETSI